MTSLDHPSISKLAAALREAGMAGAADGIRILDDEVRPLLALTSGAHRADVARLAELAGADEVGKAAPAFVREHTGQAIGGVAPMGHPRPIRTIVDEDLARYAVVWAAAGHPKSVFPTTYAGLLTLTGGTAAAVAGGEENRLS